jgi:hypothetical protein
MKHIVSSIPLYLSTTLKLEYQITYPLPKNLLPQDIEGQAQSSIKHNSEQVSEIESKREEDYLRSEFPTPHSARRIKVPCQVEVRRNACDRILAF